MAKATKRNWKGIIWNSAKVVAVLTALGLQYLEHIENVVWHRFQYEVTIHQLEIQGQVQQKKGTDT